MKKTRSTIQLRDCWLLFALEKGSKTINLLKEFHDKMMKKEVEHVNFCWIAGKGLNTLQCTIKCLAVARITEKGAAV